MEVKHGTLFQVHSLPLGLTRLFEELGALDVLSSESKKVLTRLFQTHLTKIFVGKKFDTLIGSAGIFETLVYEISNQDPMFKITSLPMQSLEQKLKDWLYSSAQERDQMQHIFLRRRQTLHLGAALLLYVIKSLNITEVFASPYALADGAALKMMEDTQA
jgi:exopolyphosphatase/pppGpp-phosphohydrolase